MARRRTHKDVEYEVSDHSGNRVGTYRSYDEAAAMALASAMSSGAATLDVLVWSKAGARFVGGDDAVESYLEDPEASVFERYDIRVNAEGRIP